MRLLLALAIVAALAGPAAAYNANGRDPTDGSTGGVNGGGNDQFGIFGAGNPTTLRMGSRNGATAGGCGCQNSAGRMSGPV